MLFPNALKPSLPRAHPLRIEQALPAFARAEQAHRVSIDLAWQARAQQHRLERRGRVARAQNINVARQILHADVTRRRLVERIEAHDVGQILHALRHLLHRVDEVALQIFLRGFAFDLDQRCKVVATEEQREHRRRGEFAIVRRPDHAWQGFAVNAMHDRRAGLGEMCGVEPNGLIRPARRAIAARQPAPHILMGIDEQSDVVLPRFVDHLHQVIEIRFVVLSRPRVLDHFPRDEETQEGQAPLTQARKVFIGLLDRKWAAHERNVAMIEETLAHVRRHPDRHFAAAREIHAAQ